MAQDKFDVGGMTCAACQAHVDRAVSKLDGVQTRRGQPARRFHDGRLRPRAGLPRRHLHRLPRGLLGLRPSMPAPAPLAQTAACKPGPAPPIWSRRPSGWRAAASTMRTRLIVSIAFLIPLFYIGMGHMLGCRCPASSPTTPTA